MNRFSLFFLALCGAALLGTSSCARADVAAQYNFDNSSLEATTLAPGISASAIGKGAGVKLDVDADAGEPGPSILLSGLENPNEAGAVHNKDYFGFSLQPQAGATLNLTELSFDVAAGESAPQGPFRNFFVRSSLDNYKETLGKGRREFRGKSENFKLNLADRPEFGNIGEKGVFFRVYAFAGVPAADIRFDNIVVSADAATVTKAAAAQAAMDASSETIAIDFSKTPVENGLTFDRRAVKPGTLMLNGVPNQGWVAKSSIEPEMPWMRSFRFKVTDPKFQNGKRPAVDLEIVYYQEANAGVEVRADTARGGRRIDGGWGATDNWRTMKIRLDDAFFGARDYPEDKQFSTSGFDLRIDSADGDFWLKSVKIIGYNTSESVDWSRLLKIKSTRGQTPGDLLVFPRRAAQKVDFELQNIAELARPLRYEMRVAGYDDKTRFQKKGELKLDASSVEPLPFSFDTKDWPLGPYDGELALYLDDKATAPTLRETFRLGVVTDTELPKARAGEFLFGLDGGNSQSTDVHSEGALAFYRLMGVDVLRNLYTKNTPRTVAGVGGALELLQKEGLRAALMMDPPAKNSDQELGKVTAKLEALARQYAGEGPGKIHFWELGNEPDLPFFYAGPISEYITAMTAMRDAIKRGADGKPTLVMNGGLSFAGPEGDKRSREFIETVGADQVDLLAYHAHGPGIESERAILEKARAVAQKAGKTDWTYIDTETGYAGADRAGVRLQAATVVEKFAYAQSQGLPTICFFRLFMQGEGHVSGYGLTDDRVQPRPAVLSYRNMVERLRFHKFDRKLDFDGESGTQGVQAFLFAERDANGQATGRKTMVMWSEKPAQYDVNVRLDDAKQAVTAPRIYDLYGNATAPEVSGSLASARVDTTPIYLSWSSPGAASSVQVAPPLLSLSNPQELLAGQTTPLVLVARNPTAEPINAELTVESASRLPLQVTPTKRTLTLAPGASQTIELSATLGQTSAPLALPKWWKVFLSPDRAKLTDASFAQIPDTLNGVKGEYVWAENNRIDFAKMAGGLAEKRPAVAYATIDSPSAVTLPATASADFWMAWYLNGQPVYDTLKRGNKGNLSNQTFELPLHKGRNVLAVMVLSGSGGWNIEWGGPRERTLAQTNSAPDKLIVALSANGKILSRQEVPLQLAAPVARISAPTDNYADWQTLEPLAVLGESSVFNFWVKEPDTSRWYGGADDLSAQVWLRDDGANLHLLAAVRDDKLVEAVSASELKQSDNLSVVLTDDAGTKLLDKTFGLVGGKAIASGQGEAQITARRDGTRTVYHVVIAKTLVGAKPFRLGVTIGDNDEGYLKQTLRLGDERGVRLAAQ